MTVPHQVGDDVADMRLDRWFLRHYPHLNKIAIEKLLRSGQVRVNKGRARADYRLQKGDELRIPPQLEKQAQEAPPAPAKAVLNKGDKLKWQKHLPSLILFENEDIIALNKPRGLAVQGGSKVAMHVDMLLPLLARGEETPRLVHRLDKQTGGVLLLAKHRKAAEALTADFKERRIGKLYWALVHGAPKPLSGRIAVAIAKRKKDGFERMDAQEGGDMAETLYHCLASEKQVSWLKSCPLSGRTHQIRVHLAHIGTPLIGDRKYGGKPPKDNVKDSGKDSGKHIYLHARAVRYRDHIITAPIDEDFENRMKIYGFDAKLSLADRFL